jgi:ATP-dependent Clp protease ATP-binding subunit ClpA
VRAAVEQSALGFRPAANAKAREKHLEIIREELEQHFRPEFLNRLDGVVTFDYLNQDAVRRIFDLELAKMRKRLAPKKIQVEVSPEAMDRLIQTGYSEKTGARGLRRIIEERVEDPLSEMIILGQVHQGDSARLDVEDNEIRLHVLEAQHKGK